MSVTIKQKGNFKKVDKYFTNSLKFSKVKNINRIAEQCIEQLKIATPKDSGITAESWKYTIVKNRNSFTLNIFNTNNQNGVNIVWLLEYGHLTRDGKWLSGQHFVEPILKETYNDILKNTWKEIEKL